MVSNLTPTLVSVLLGETTLWEAERIQEANLVNRPALEAFVTGYVEQLKIEDKAKLATAKTMLKKQAIAWLSNSKEDCLEAGTEDFPDEIPDWIRKCVADGKRVDLFKPRPETTEMMDMVVEYLSSRPERAVNGATIDDWKKEAADFHLHPSAKVQRNHHDYSKSKERGGTCYTISPVAEWTELTKERRERRQARLAQRRAAGEQVGIADGAPVTLKLFVKDKQIVDMSGYTFSNLNPENSTELKEATEHLVQREGLDVTSSMPVVATLPGGYKVVALTSNGARDYITVVMKHCIGLGNYDSGCFTYAIADPDGDFIVALAVKNGVIYEAMGVANSYLTNPGDPRMALVKEFEKVPGFKTFLVQLARGGQRVLRDLRPGDATASLDLRGVTDLVLPDNLTVNGQLNLSNSRKVRLGVGLKVSGTLNLRGSDVASVPEDAVVGELRATYGKIDHRSVCLWVVRGQSEQLEKSFVGKHCDQHYPEETLEQRKQRFASGVLQELVDRAVAMDLNQVPANQVPGKGNLRRRINAVYKDSANT